MINKYKSFPSLRGAQRRSNPEKGTRRLQIGASIMNIKYLLVVLLFLAIAGCRKEKEEDFSLPRDKYIGSWRCQDEDGAGYIANISSDPSNSAQVRIQNYFNLRGTVTAIVTEGTITVNLQVMQGILGTYRCEGFGRLSKKNVTYTIYREKYIANDEEITSTYTKQ
jgi:hypothetical protein